MDRQVNRPIFTWPAGPPRPGPGPKSSQGPDPLPTSPSGHSGPKAGSLLHRRSGLPPPPALREHPALPCPRARGGRQARRDRRRSRLCRQTSANEHQHEVSEKRPAPDIFTTRVDMEICACGARRWVDQDGTPATPWQSINLGTKPGERRDARVAPRTPPKSALDGLITCGSCGKPMLLRRHPR